MPATASGWIALAAVTTAATVGTQAILSHKQRKKEAAQAEKEAEKQRKWQEQMYAKELEAGEYFEQLTMEQMELQAQSANIQTLADLIATQKAINTQAQTSPQIYTLPAAKTYTPIQKLNMAIDQLVRG